MLTTRGDSWNRRQRLDIIYEILKASQIGCLKTQIVYKANINSKLAKKYVNLLLESGMLELKQNEYTSEIYEATPKAMEFVRTYQYLMRGFQSDTMELKGGTNYEE